jgi:hypothetical protein
MSASPGDTISIPGSIGTITLVTPIAVSQTAPGITISGAGASATTISGGGTTQIFSLGSSASLAISGVTMTGGAGDPGGAVEALGGATLMLTDSVLKQNTTPDIGGAIQMNGGGTLTVLRTTLSGNTAGGGASGIGGAIQMNGSGTLSVNNSTISGNTASGTDASGGAVQMNGGGTLTLTNSTVSGNRAAGSSTGAGGALQFNTGATITILNSTVAGNSATTSGGALSANSPGTTSVKNTIVWGNTALSGASCDTSLTSAGHNDASDTSCGLNGSGDIHSDPMLGPLQNNGGPTSTMALSAGSPAIAAGDTNGCPATDQRGVARSGHCDIGAFQFTSTGGPPPPPKPLPPFGTKITHKKINKHKHRASFTYTARGAITGFQCALVRVTKSHKKPKLNWKPCGKSSPSKKTYTHLSRGRYMFEVRAFNPAGRTAPAVKKFKI